MDNVVVLIAAVLGSGVLNILLNRFFLKRDMQKNENTGLVRACRLLMKNQIRDLCYRYIDKQWIYKEELEDLIVLHNSYHDDLGGNGWLTSLMERVKALEIRGIGVK